MLTKSKEFFDFQIDEKKPFSIIEIGTFSIRLVVYDRLSYASRTLFNEKIITNMGYEVIAQSQISKKSISTLIDYVKRFIKLSAGFTSFPPLLIATAAIRKSKNREFIVAQFETKLKAKLNILSEKLEADFAVKGIKFSYILKKGVVADLGGGSMELSSVKGKKVNFINSLSIGHVYLKQIGQPGSLDVEKYLIKNFEKIKILKNCKQENLYLIGGNFRALSKIHMFLKNLSFKLIQDYSVDAKDFLDTIEKKIFISGKPNKKFVAKFSSSRVDTIPYAFLVLKKLIYYTKLKTIYFSSNSIREGIIFDILNKKNYDPFIDQVIKLSRNTISLEMAKKTNKWIQKFLLKNKIVIDKHLCLACCILLNFSRDIHPENRRIFTLERVFYYPFSYLTRSQRVYLSLAMYFRHSNGLKDKEAKQLAKGVDKQKIKELVFFGQCLRLIYHITAGKDCAHLKYCELTLNNKKLYLKVKKKEYLFKSNAIVRGLNNAGKSLGLKGGEVFKIR